LVSMALLPSVSQVALLHLFNYFVKKNTAI
jgi:hypothetical protein